MRFVGLVLLLIGLAAAYFLGYLGLTVDQARARLAQLLNLPGLAPPASSSSNGWATAKTLDPFAPTIPDPSAVIKNAVGNAVSLAKRTAGQA